MYGHIRIQTYAWGWHYEVKMAPLLSETSIFKCRKRLRQWHMSPSTTPLVMPLSYPTLSLQVLKMTEFLAVPLAVLHTSACISAKRICAVRFVFPLAGIHNLLCISSSGNRNQNNYKISARGDAIFWLHFRKRNCRRWIVFPRGGIVNFHVHLRSRGRCTEIIKKSPLRLRGCKILIAFPQAELSILDRIPARGE